MLIDLLADLDPDPGIFHSGCVVAEIRDLRPGGRPAKPRHVLLRPSAQSLICDSQAMARAPGHARWTSEDRASLESQVVFFFFFSFFYFSFPGGAGQRANPLPRPLPRRVLSRGEGTPRATQIRDGAAATRDNQALLAGRSEQKEKT